MRDTPTGRRLRRELDLILTRLDRQGRAGDGGPAGSNFAGDLVEDAQAVEAQALSELSYGRLARRARTIRNALVRLEDGRYGRCEECGVAIPAARLRAVPDAATCLACQETMERARTGPASAPGRTRDGRLRDRGTRRAHHLGRAVTRYST